PAGELAALVGAAALEADRAARRHGFRGVAARALAKTPAADRARYTAYAEGVNAGLAALDRPPFEYLLLRTTPEPWRPEDAILSGLAMYGDLQNPNASAEAVLAVMEDVLPAPLAAFLAADASDWETPVDGLAIPVASVPGPEVFDLRASLAPVRPLTREDHARLARAEAWFEDESALGSNNWAVAGAHTASGAALVANDMHLRISVPNIWYRASIVMPDPSGDPAPLRQTGVTMPGMPVMIVGSNGHIAWGYTNSQADWHDLVVIEPDPRDPTQYLTPDGPRPFDLVTGTIQVKGGADEPVETRWTIWGPVWDTDHQGRERALRWVAHDDDVLARSVDRFTFAKDTAQALQLAAHTALPGQNLVVGDTAGRIGWTLAGTLPVRVGFTGQVPVSWADGTRRWDGWLPVDVHPRIIDPPDGRLWTANARVVGGERLQQLGEGNYSDGVRARIIRDGLLALDRATPADMLALQLSDDGRFLERWRTRLLATLTPEAIAASPARAEFARLLDATWTGRASIDSVAYRLTRQARAVVSRLAFAPFGEQWREVAPAASYARMRRAEGPLWRLVTEQPAHLLNPAYDSWPALILAAVDETIGELTAEGDALAGRTWGEANRAAIGHPLAAAVPLIGRWLNMPPDPLPGDVYTPRASSPRAGASQRMAVTPGREDEGLMVMPVGQSGHPWSPYYRSHHEAWVTGQALPFLPGQTVHTLVLKDR
ncbi:MAG: penicillin acylase family protein, partial [Vicinamibacterales bacterium]|nr:penicillin acylase family protein [Vicinamibacterales bacterium]